MIYPFRRSKQNSAALVAESSEALSEARKDMKAPVAQYAKKVLDGLSAGGPKCQCIHGPGPAQARIQMHKR